jgi:hypothetical protein
MIPPNVQRHRFYTAITCFVTEMILPVAFTLCFLTKTTHFVTDMLCFVAKMTCSVTFMLCFVIKMIHSVTFMLCFITKMIRSVPSTIKSPKRIHSFFGLNIGIVPNYSESNHVTTTSTIWLHAPFPFLRMGLLRKYSVAPRLSPSSLVFDWKVEGSIVQYI